MSTLAFNHRSRRATPGSKPKKTRSAVFSFLLLLFAAQTTVLAQSINSTRNVSLPLSCTVDGKSVPDVTATLSANGKVLSIDGKALLEVIRDKAVPALVESIRELAKVENSVAVSDLENTGLKITFDEQKLVLSITIPPGLQKVKRLDVNAVQPPATAVHVKPAAVSAQLSIYGRLDAIDQYSSGEGQSYNSFSLPLTLTLDPAVNLYTWVLEGELSLNTAAAAPVSLLDLRLVKDLPGPDLRLSAGNLVYPVTGFLSSVPTVGVGVSRNFDLSPNRVYRPLGAMEFYLESPSNVTVLVNGQPVEYLNLQPGPYKMSDFPLTPGMNNVSLEITDAKGRVRYISGSFPFDSNLLARGVSSFSWNIGLPGWEIAVPVLSGFQSIGVTSNMTMGGYAQADTSDQLMGIQALFATTAGRFSADVAGSNNVDYGLGFGLSATYSLYSAEHPRWPSLNLSTYYRSRYFLGPQSGLTQSPYRWILSAGISQALPADVYLNLGMDLRTSWMNSQSCNVNVIVSAPIASGLTLSGIMSASFASGQAPNVYGQITLIKTLSGGVASLSQSITSPNSQVDVSFQPASAPNFSINGELVGPPAIEGQSTGGSVSASYQGNRFDAAAGHSFSALNVDGTTSIANHSYVRFATALVYADGNAAVTQPVTDCFAIFTRRKTLGNTLLGVDPLGASFTAHSDFLGNAALSGIQSYTYTLANVEVPDAPISYDLGNMMFLLDLPYRSGAVVSVGTNATVYADGALVAPDGKPVALLAGSFAPQAGGSSEQFFTDTSGKFQVYGLRPGSYTVEMAGGLWKPVNVTIPQTASGLYDIGKIVLESAKTTPK